MVITCRPVPVAIQGSLDFRFCVSSPTLPRNAPRAVVLFAGGGGVEAGMVMAGCRPVCSVEHDPSNPALSRAIAESNRMNFDQYGHRVIEKTVQEMEANSWYGVLREPDILHASPVCSNFSQCNGLLANALDLSAAHAIASAIRVLRPKRFSLENVPTYWKSDCFFVVTDALDELGMPYEVEIIDSSLYGVPQSRQRMFLLSGLRFPAPTSLPTAWYPPIADIIDDLEDGELLDCQKQNLERKLRAFPEAKAIALGRVGDGRKKARIDSEPLFTITRMMTTDQSGRNRAKFIDIWLKGGRVKRADIRCLSRWQGFPDWYRFPSRIADAGAIVGYSVPPALYQQLELI